MSGQGSIAAEFEHRPGPDRKRAGRTNREWTAQTFGDAHGAVHLFDLPERLATLESLSAAAER